MKKLLLLPTILILVSCQPSELDRCIEANMSELNESQRKDINYKILYSYEVVFPDEKSKAEYISLMIVASFPYGTVADLSTYQEFYDSFEIDEVDNPDTYRQELQQGMKNFKNVYDYNKEYYGLSDGVYLETYLKKTATSICNKQGIY